MLNHSLAQLRQVAFANLVLEETNVPSRTRSGSVIRFATPTKQAPAWSSLEETSEEVQESPSKRPGTLRRRSTRTKTALEDVHSRSRRHEAAIRKHTYESFFVLYEKAKSLFVSEVQQGLSPVFLPFRVESRERDVDLVLYTRRSSVELTPTAKWRELIRIHFDVNRVKSVGRKAETREQSAVLLQFSGPSASWYMPVSQDEELPQSYVAPRAESHSFNQLIRLQMVTEVINDARQSIHAMRKEIEGLLEENTAHYETTCSVETLSGRMEDCKIAHARLKRVCTSDAHRVTMLRERNKQRAAKLAAVQASDDLQNQARLLRDRTTTRAGQLVPIESEIRRVQRVVTTKLAAIYPICTTPSQNTIQNLNLARHSVFSASYSAEEAAALGYTAHLIALLAKYMFIRLRYPLKCAGSSSHIIDPISLFPESSDPDERGAGPPYSMRKDRRYPLFYSKADMPRFNYGVYLLNKNVEQLMQARGLVCGELRDTLINLGVLVFWTTSITEDEDMALSSPARRRRLSNATSQRTRLSRIDSVGAEGPDEEVEYGDDEIVNHDDVLRARSKVKLQGLMQQNAGAKRSVREKLDLAMSSDDEVVTTM